MERYIPYSIPDACPVLKDGTAPRTAKDLADVNDIPLSSARSDMRELKGAIDIDRNAKEFFYCGAGNNVVTVELDDSYLAPENGFRSMKISCEGCIYLSDGFQVTQRRKIQTVPKDPDNL